jgi:hypothetical protein
MVAKPICSSTQLKGRDKTSVCVLLAVRDGQFFGQCRHLTSYPRPVSDLMSCELDSRSSDPLMNATVSYISAASSLTDFGLYMEIYSCEGVAQNETSKMKIF